MRIFSLKDPQEAGKTYPCATEFPGRSGRVAWSYLGTGLRRT